MSLACLKLTLKLASTDGKQCLSLNVTFISSHVNVHEEMSSDEDLCHVEIFSSE